MKNNILHQVPSTSKIKREIKKVVFGKMLFCPRCGSRQVNPHEKRYRCRCCRKPFSFTSVTWLKGMKLPLQTFWLLLWCWVNKVSIEQATKLCGVSKPTTRRWYGKFRAHLPREKIDAVTLSGVIQMDEAYRGGKKHGYSIIGAKEEKQPGRKAKLALQVIERPSVDRRDAVSFLAQRIAPDSKLQTDGASIYRGIDRWWRVDHEYERHNRWELTLTSEIEGLWGTMTTFIRRMYHHVTRSEIVPVTREFVARTMYPEWFSMPSSYLAQALQPIARPVRPEWRGQYQKKQMRIHTLKTSNYPVISLTNRLSPVPS